MINEEASSAVVALTFEALKLTEAEFAKAVKTYLNNKADSPVSHGKMKLKDLMQLDQGANMMEIKADCIKGFERIAGKYNIDFAVMKDKTKEPAVYQVFFKGRDQDVIAKAFNEFVKKHEKQQDRVSFAQKLQKMKEKADILNAARVVKDKHRAMEKVL